MKSNHTPSVACKSKKLGGGHEENYSASTQQVDITRPLLSPSPPPSAYRQALLREKAGAWRREGRGLWHCEGRGCREGPAQPLRDVAGGRRARAPPFRFRGSRRRSSPAPTCFSSRFQDGGGGGGRRGVGGGAVERSEPLRPERRLRPRAQVR